MPAPANDTHKLTKAAGLWPGSGAASGGSELHGGRHVGYDRVSTTGSLNASLIQVSTRDRRTRKPNQLHDIGIPSCLRKPGVTYPSDSLLIHRFFLSLSASPRTVPASYRTGRSQRFSGAAARCRHSQGFFTQNADPDVDSAEIFVKLEIFFLELRFFFSTSRKNLQR